MSVACATLMTFADGRAVDLLAPKASDIRFDTFAHHLALLNRYGGAARLPYSVAEHLALGADAIMRETGDRELAQAYVLHDVEEAAIGDAITPLKRALGELAVSSNVAASDSLLGLYKLLGYRWNVAIHAAAGVVWPLPVRLQREVEHWDLRMLRTEWRDLMMGAAPFAWPQGIEPLRSFIVPMEWREARRALIDRFAELLPVFARSGGRMMNGVHL